VTLWLPSLKIGKKQKWKLFFLGSQVTFNRPLNICLLGFKQVGMFDPFLGIPEPAKSQEQRYSSRLEAIELTSAYLQEFLHNPPGGVEK
jgi:hypothetical protein